MQERNFNTRSQQQLQQDPIEIFKRNVKMLWNKKWPIVIVTFTISIIWLFVYPYILKQPEYSSSVVIKFDDPRLTRGGVGAFTDFAPERSEGKVAVLYTNSLLEEVVDSLQLNVRVNTKGISRFSFFKKIEIDSNAKFGEYEMIFDEESSNILIYYTNPIKEIRNEFIGDLSFNRDSQIVFNKNGLNMFLNQNEFLKHNKIVITFISKRFVVEMLKKKISSKLDRSSTVLTVSYEDKDPEVSAAVINALSEFYINKLLDYKRYRTSSVLKSLEDQLNVARIALEVSENMVREFRERNPFLMLSREGANIVTQLSDQQSEISEIERSLERINYLIQNKNNLSGTGRNAAYQEILSAISAREVAGSQVMLDQYSNLIDEKNRLLTENYSEDHMLVQDVLKRLSNMQQEIDTRVNQFINQLQSQKNSLEKTVNNNERNIRRLPRNELRLAELERDREVKSNIYSSILIRYNEAKVSDASVIPDAFIIEEAQVPFVLSSITSKILKLLLGPILGFFIIIGILIIRNFLDKSIKNSKEVESKLNLPVLATIPIIIDEKEMPGNLEDQKHLDSKLITSNFAPTLANENFRLLRTKLFMQNIKKHIYIISSLTSGDGKSLIASNIAITFAQQKNSTLLVDCDLRRGVLHNSFKCNKKPGMSDLLLKNKPIDQSEISSHIQNTHIPNLFLFASGMQIPNPSELLGSIRMQQFLKIVQEKFSVVILDTPPIDFIPDALVLNSFVHNILLVVRYGKTNLNQVDTKLSEFVNIKNDFKGIIINASIEAEMEKYHSYSYYHY